MEITVKGQTVSTRPKPQARHPLVAATLAVAAMMGIGGATPGAERVLRNPGMAGGIPTPDVPRVPHRGKGHKHKVPHRGTSRRANRTAKRRRARARSR